MPLLERELVPTGWIRRRRIFSGVRCRSGGSWAIIHFCELSWRDDEWGGWGRDCNSSHLPSVVFINRWGSAVSKSDSQTPRFQAALTAINAAVVGILLAALYDPIWTSTVNTTVDFAVALALFGLLAYWKLPPWIVVLIGAIVGSLVI